MCSENIKPVIAGSFLLSRSELQGMREKDEEVILPPKDCDLFTGQWIFDNVTPSLYIEEKCEKLVSV
jgi:hypothetical protein